MRFSYEPLVLYVTYFLIFQVCHGRGGVPVSGKYNYFHFGAILLRHRSYVFTFFISGPLHNLDTDSISVEGGSVDFLNGCHR